MQRCGVTMDGIALLVPHQANQRIIDSVGKHIGADKNKVFLTIQKYGNMSSATAPVALIEAVESGRVPAGGLVLIPAFGAGLTMSAHLLKWGERTSPLASSDAELPPCDKTALDIVNEIRAQKSSGKSQTLRFATLEFADAPCKHSPDEPR
jgi:3-oxoacyl-[acyl-carrier-protein] synthase-3